MKLLSLSDLHLSPEKKPQARLDDHYNTQFEKFEFILDYAERNNCIILQGGDFFHSSRNYHLLTDTMEILNQYESVKINSVFGQHDRYLNSKELETYSNLGILSLAGYINILRGNKALIIDSVNIYGVSFGDEGIPKIIDKKAFNILVIHKEISNNPLFYGHKYSSAETFLNKTKFDLVLCADIHQKFFIRNKKNQVILNTGPVFRREATRYNLTHKPNFWVYDTESCKYTNVIIPHAPSKEVLSRIHIENRNKKKEILSTFINEIQNEIQAEESPLPKIDFKDESEREEALTTFTSNLKKDSKNQKSKFDLKLNKFIKENEISFEVVKYLEKVIYGD